jgi:hypothetical protein
MVMQNCHLGLGGSYILFADVARQITHLKTRPECKEVFVLQARFAICPPFLQLFQLSLAPPIKVPRCIAISQLMYRYLGFLFGRFPWVSKYHNASQRIAQGEK